MERWGYHIVPNHFYFPIPDTRNLSSSLWDEPDDQVPGLKLDAQGMRSRLVELASRYGPEVADWPRHQAALWSDHPAYYVENGRFMSVDAELLYFMIREARPKHVIEIGAGYSTLVTALALETNARDKPGRDGAVFTSIDPYPEHWIGTTGQLTEVRPIPVQAVPIADFQGLGEGDVLFIDSSHVLKAGSDVQYLLLHVLPRLAPGVIVHLHDIFMPYEYPKDWIMEKRLFWTESYAVQAFLTFNDRFEVLWSSALMTRVSPDLVRRLLPHFAAAPSHHRPGSLWLRRYERK
jgi:predicted O-methyltransferase YrrM